MRDMLLLRKTLEAAHEEERCMLLLPSPLVMPNPSPIPSKQTKSAERWLFRLTPMSVEEGRRQADSRAEAEGRGGEKEVKPRLARVIAAVTRRRRQNRA